MSKRKRDNEPESEYQGPPLVAQEVAPSPVAVADASKLSASEYDAIFAERQRRFAEKAARRNHRGILGDPTVYTPPKKLRGKHAIGREPNAVLRKCVVLSDGHRRHRTVHTVIGSPCQFLLGQTYVDGISRSQRAPSEDGADPSGAEARPGDSDQARR